MGIFERRGQDAAGIDDEAPGWDSIDAAFRSLYAGEPRHVAPDVQPPFAGGVLNGISAYRGEAHWHFVTYGLTDLFFKTEGDDPEVSGWGYELSLATPATDDPPNWAYALLLGIARTTVERGEVYEEGIRLSTGPIANPESPLTAVAFCRDPITQPSSFPFGKYRFLRAVGVTSAERQEMKDTSTDAVLDRLSSGDPLLRTDPTR